MVDLALLGLVFSLSLPRKFTRGSVCDGASTSIAAGDEVTIEGFPGPMVGDKT